MEKKAYKTPCIKVRKMSAQVMLITSGGENNLRMFSTDDIQDANVAHEVIQW